MDGPRLEAAFRKHFYRADRSETEQSRQILVGHGNIFRFFILRYSPYDLFLCYIFFICFLFLQNRQECIPVGCVLSAAVAVGGGLPRGRVSTQGVSAPMHAGIHPPCTESQTPVKTTWPQLRCGR